MSAWVASATDAWVSDDAGSAWHFDGTSWTESPASTFIDRVMGSPEGTVWAVARGPSAPSLLRRDGDDWVVPMPVHAYCIGGDFIVLEDDEVWSTGLVCDDTGAVVGIEVHRFDGADWMRVGERLDDSLFPRITRIDGRVRVGSAQPLEWDGTSWRPVAMPLPPPVVPDGQTVRFDGLGYTTLPASIPCSVGYRLDATQVWCFGDGQIFFANGEAWSSTLVDEHEDTSDAAAWGTIPTTLWTGGDSFRAWGSGPTDVYRVRRNTGFHLEHFDGESWTIVLESIVHDLDGTAPDDVWLATEDGVVHYDGSAFVDAAIPTELAEAVVDEIHMIGRGAPLASADGRLFVYRGGAWISSFTARDTWTIGSIGGTSANDVWLVQARGGRTDEMELMHFDGASWSAAEPGHSWSTELVTAGEDTWLSTDGSITRLGSTDAPITSESGASGASLWVGSDALWLTTMTRARRFPLR